MESGENSFESNKPKRERKSFPHLIRVAALISAAAALGCIGIGIFAEPPQTVTPVMAPRNTAIAEAVDTSEDEDEAAAFSDIWAEEVGETVPPNNEPTVEPTVELSVAPSTAVTSTRAPSTPKVTTPAPSSSPVIPTPAGEQSPYMIYVSKNTYTIAILGLDANGEYTRLVRRFSTGIGRSSAQTRVGTFVIESKQRWHKWGTDSYSPYATKYSAGVWVHGPIYTAMDSNSMKPGSYNKIGTACSGGCLRTTCSAAAWVYYNCPKGTVVYVAGDSKYSAAAPARIPDTQRYDPTDPGATPEIPITSFTLSAAAIELQVGGTATVGVASYLPTDSSTTSFTFSSSAPDIASITASGAVTAHAIGTAVITVTADDVSGVSRTCRITVAPVPTPTPAHTPTVTPTPEEPTPTPEEPTPTPEEPTPTPEVPTPAPEEPTPTPEGPTPTPEDATP